MKYIVKYNILPEAEKYQVSIIDATEDVCGVSVTLIPLERVYRFWRWDVYVKGKPEHYYCPEDRFISFGDGKDIVWARVNAFIKNAIVDSKTMKILELLVDSRQEPYLFLNNCLKL